MSCDNSSMSKCVILWTAGPAKYLHDVKHAKINKRTLLGIIDLCSLKEPQTTANDLAVNATTIFSEYLTINIKVKYAVLQRSIHGMLISLSRAVTELVS